jgi:hypothetical protein
MLDLFKKVQSASILGTFHVNKLWNEVLLLKILG